MQQTIMGKMILVGLHAGVCGNDPQDDSTSSLLQLMLFGFFICLDAFLFLFTFLPLRLLLAVISLLYRFLTCSMYVSGVLLCCLSQGEGDRPFFYKLMVIGHIQISHLHLRPPHIAIDTSVMGWYSWGCGT